MLTDTALKNLKSKDKTYKAADRDGMYAEVRPTGTIVFRFDYRLHGRRETLTLPVRPGWGHARPGTRAMHRGPQGR